ncbi:hypothetical protein [Gemmobacter sp.]|uniref:hypothetical protein n=1 Tax=Gemmobacter sp. TaxID=1898957 RepID=UPI002AFF77E5|nr:hypothetical protein [Gemmobacter sp.]
MINATELAAQLGLSKARVSQYVSQGVLDGCFEGDGRSRRFDPDRVKAALKRNLDPGQMLGNGSKTRAALKAEPRPMSAIAAAISEPRTPVSTYTDGALSASDLDRYELARIQSAEEDARKKRRENEREEGRWVLADEVQRQTARAIAQEVAQFETVIRDAARAAADHFGLDFREVRKVLMDQWRSHRGIRASDLETAADQANMTETEKAEQV